MSSKFKRQLELWVLGLASGSIQGGATAAKAFFGAAGAHVLAPQLVSALDGKQAGAVFAAAAIYHACDFVSKNPLKDLATLTPTLSHGMGEGAENQAQKTS